MWAVVIAAIAVLVSVVLGIVGNTVHQPAPAVVVPPVAAPVYNVPPGYKLVPDK
jgi:hypothetical protein